MRNITAEKLLVDKTFTFAGSCTLLGIIVMALGSEIWIINQFFLADFPIFLVLQGIWLIVLGLTLAILASLVHRGQRS